MKAVQKVKESLGSGSQQYTRFTKKLLTAGTSLSDDFMSDIYGKRRQTPHRKMQNVREMIGSNTMVAHNVEAEALSIVGREIGFESDDPETVEWFEDNIKNQIYSPILEQANDLAGFGNGYVEVIRNNAGIPSNFKHIARPEKMYIDYANGFEPTAYIKEKSHLKDSRRNKYRVSYKGRSGKTVKGTRWEADEIIHAKYKKNAIIPAYGDSTLSSGYNEHLINRELKRSKAVMAKLKTVQKKLYELSNKDGSTVRDKDVKDFSQQLENSEDAENIAYGDKQVDVKNIDYNVSGLNLDEMIQATQRNLTAGTPSYVTHPEVTRNAVAGAEQNMFFLGISAKEHAIKTVWNEVLREIARKRNLSVDIELTLGEFDFPTREQKVQEAVEQWRSGGITLNEFRQACGKEPIPESDEGGIGDAFRFELTGNDPLSEALKDKINDELPDEDEQGGTNGDYEQETAGQD